MTTLPSTRRELRRLRLAASGLAAAKAASPADAVGRLLAVQAQNAAGAAWSIGQRTVGGTESGVRAAIAGRGLVLTWTMRGTQHLVRAVDAAWLVPLLGPRANAQQAGLRRAAGVSEEILDRCTRAVAEALSGGPAARSVLVKVLATAGGLTDSAAASHVLRFLAQSQVIVFAPPAGKTATFELYARVISPAAPLPRDDALATLAVRYVQGHGPVRAQDLAWWSGLTLRDARRAFEVAGDRITPLTAAEPARGEDRWWVAPELLEEQETGRSGGVRLLPGFDEYHIGYADRDLIMAAEHRAVVGPAKNGLFRNVLLVDGRIAGIWERNGSTVDVEPFLMPGRRDVDSDPVGLDPAELERAVQEYGSFRESPGNGS
ncbi:winged helix DNA-binding domain-containing protein [Arthrobacter sp. zg-Y750]|uniref:winged helix DNA-binding domain-containing protein n=1 Tax=Arthrobacter sp. zg-Y750 TaxID=2894189 RepID=UPI001E456738|nr:winged helix DNA-binding domain-containing protein [Arthrobacter sp. zg-Y750]MCC9177683.1 winged helix DNA-binding domain-containing protein [Arthrobacter sp. zg-Y750]